MASTLVQSRGRYLALGVGSALKSGDPVVVGQIAGVLQQDAAASTYLATVDTEGVYNLAVKGEDENGSKAIVAGDIVYWDTEAGYLNVDLTDGVRFGYALDPVSGNATTTIRVKVGYS